MNLLGMMDLAANEYIAQYYEYTSELVEDAPTFVIWSESSNQIGQVADEQAYREARAAHSPVIYELMPWALFFVPAESPQIPKPVQI